MNLPLEFISQMKNQLGSEADAFFRAMQAPYERGIRMNPIKSAPKPAGVQESIPWARDGFYLSADSDAGADILHEAGAYYIQEPSAMAPAEVLNAQPYDVVWTFVQRREENPHKLQRASIAASLFQTKSI